MTGRGAVATGALTLALVGGCTAAGGEADAVVDPELAPLYEQVLSWEPCSPSSAMECASLTVPRDYERPAEGTRELAVYRLAPAGAEDGATEDGADDGAGGGAVVVLPGGPGGSGQFLLEGLSPFRELAADRAVVSYDPRGVNASDAVSCEDDAAFAARQALDATPDTAQEEAALVAAFEAFADACASAVGDDLAHMGTADLVRDLDLLRAALGEDRLSYLGLSYGSLVGLEYARAFPDRVGRVALDSPMTAAGRADADREEVLLVRIEETLDGALQACVDAPAGCRLGTGVGEARDRVETLLDELDAAPVEVGGRVLTREVVVSWLWDALTWGPESSATAVAALGRASGGQWGDVALLLGPGDVPGFAAYTAVACSDALVPVADAAAARAAAADLGERFPVFGETAAWWDVACSGWPVDAALAVADDVVEHAGEALVVASTGDPLTPPVAVDEASRQMGGAPVLTYAGAEHVAYWFSDCTRFAVNDFLVDGTLPAVGTCA